MRDEATPGGNHATMSRGLEHGRVLSSWPAPRTSAARLFARRVRMFRRISDAFLVATSRPARTLAHWLCVAIVFVGVWLLLPWSPLHPLAAQLAVVEQRDPAVLNFASAALLILTGVVQWVAIRAPGWRLYRGVCLLAGVQWAALLAFAPMTLASPIWLALALAQGWAFLTARA